MVCCHKPDIGNKKRAEREPGPLLFEIPMAARMGDIAASWPLEVAHPIC
jgi:hypothetical protein